MNPNLQHAQAVPGRTTGRGYGLTDTIGMIILNEGLSLIADSPAWTQTDRAAMKQWLEKLYTWLRTSANGRDEQNAGINHGTWYDAQAAHLYSPRAGTHRRCARHPYPRPEPPARVAG